MAMTTEKIVYLMRGLPCCGKSHRAKELAGDRGIVLETDEYFLTQVGDDPTSYDYHEKWIMPARQWNYERFKQAILDKRPLIVVDRGNSYNKETFRYADFAHKNGYRVELAEPTSAWWQEIRVLLKYKRYTRPVLYQWAKKLEEKSERDPPHHQVSAEFIRHLMDHWRSDVTIDKILNYQNRKHK